MEVHGDCAQVWCGDCVEVRGDCVEVRGYFLEGMEIV